ncbi:hypothetical protein ACPPVS_00180 [Cellulomonas sp. McL0617]|uniref:hypothetical protein n=1 Tax=Cellulomonas sp. McL0617 TaxID=3415675 RepID=UPI003CF4138C
MPGMTPVAVPNPVALTKSDDDCGCAGDPSTALERAVGYAQSYKAEAMNAAPGVYSDIQVHALPPDTMEYEFIFAQEASATAAPAYLDTQLVKFQAICDSKDFPSMKRIGIAHPKIHFLFVNADGTTLWEHTFEPS